MPSGLQRLRQTIDAARAERRAALLVCLPAIDNLSWSLAAARACVAAGADLLEFQTVYPRHPAPTVEALAEIAAGVDAPCLLWSDFDTVNAFTILDNAGWRLVPECVAAGIAGLAAPVPMGCGEAFADACGDDLAPVGFVAPTMQPKHFDEVCRCSSVFTYAIGVKTAPPSDPRIFEDFAGFVERVREASGTHVFVGAGVTTPAQAALAATFADGVAVATAVFVALDDAARRGESQIDALASLVGMLRGAVERDCGSPESPRP